MKWMHSTYLVHCFCENALDFSAILVQTQDVLWIQRSPRAHWCLWVAEWLTWTVTNFCISRGCPVRAGGCLASLILSIFWGLASWLALVYQRGICIKIHIFIMVDIYSVRISSWVVMFVNLLLWAISATRDSCEAGGSVFVCEHLTKLKRKFEVAVPIATTA